MRARSALPRLANQLRGIALQHLGHPTKPLAIAIERSGGNISCVGRWLGSSRRMIRESLRSAGLYARGRPG